ncbi:PREDICTED: uncharacterized protein LOC104613364 [Nelumbo nucifera]|uniref:Uncharacterized protein LOC104613364 n=1 Tax=Nelumbo nucifera TaxID=4432 RepID=A0A1U8BDE4_NELNU|nr:PREDICTED: uncharacterized protein LOC104613364 [Nelumbo nucifera]
MEILTLFCKKVVVSGEWEGFAIVPGGEKVNILQFAGDTLCFVDAFPSQVELILGILSWFEVTIGLKVNWNKNQIIPVGHVSNLLECVDILACQIESLPVKYLGLPLGVSGGSSTIWDPVIERLERKLASWKTKYLSFGGRVTLIKSTLSNLPIYFLSLFSIPNKVANQI